MQYDWILFDADNTLFDFHASSELAFFEAFRLNALEVGPEHYEAFRQINLETWQAFDENKLDHEQIKEIRFSRLFEAFGIEGLEPLRFNAEYFDQLVRHTRYVPGAKELLDQLEGRLRMGVITNGMKEVQRPRLESSGLIHRFDLIVISGEIGHSKPNPAFFQFAADRMNYDAPDRVLVVGDNLYADIRGGNEFGFHTAWFNPDRLPLENGIEPNHEINALHEIMAIVGNN